MREPALAATLVAAVRRAVPAAIPVTVKHRTGWDESSINASDFALRLVDVGAAMITVHGRTRAQGFSGQARLEPIAAVRAALPASIPVVGNGDVKDVAAFHRMREGTGCDAVMIGRGAMGNPWIFRSLAAVCRGDVDPGAPTLDERHAVWRRHADLCLQYAPEKMRVHELRKTLAWYSRGLRGGAQLRQQSGATADLAALRDLGDAFFTELCRQGDEPDAAGNLFTVPASAVSKAIARNERRSGPGHVEADEPSLAAAPVAAAAAAS
ncbi:MAG: tRNA-dihydrouridine synthase, partial [Pseudomonadota bacterium]